MDLTTHLFNEPKRSELPFVYLTNHDLPLYGGSNLLKALVSFIV